MKVLITGGFGFVGWPVIQSLLREGHTVLALSRKMPEEAKSMGIKFKQADLGHPLEYRDVVRAFAPEVVIHMAWQDIPDYSFETSLVNLERSLDLLSFVAGLGSCRKVLVSGSCWELNRLKGECLETETGTPNDNFTWAKLSLHSWLEVECRRKDIRLGWMRIFYVYGPRQRPKSLVQSILSHLREGKLPQLRTPENANDFVYVDDVADAFLLAVSRDFPSGIYNLGSGVSTPVIEVCRVAERNVTGKEKLTRQLESEMVGRECEVEFWADFSRSRELLGWFPKTSLDDGIRRTWQWTNGI